MELVIPNLQIPYQAIKSRGTEQEIQLTSFTLIDSDTVSQPSIDTAHIKSNSIMEDQSTSQLDQQNRTINRTSTNPDRRTTKNKGIYWTRERTTWSKRIQMGTFKGNEWLIRIWTFMTSHVTIQSLKN